MKEKYIYIGIGVVSGLAVEYLVKAIRCYHKVRKWKKLGMDFLKYIATAEPKDKTEEEEKSEETQLDIPQIDVELTKEEQE